MIIFCCFSFESSYNSSSLWSTTTKNDTSFRVILFLLLFILAMNRSTCFIVWKNLIIWCVWLGFFLSVHSDLMLLSAIDKVFTHLVFLCVACSSILFEFFFPFSLHLFLSLFLSFGLYFSRKNTHYHINQNEQQENGINFLTCGKMTETLLFPSFIRFEALNLPALYIHKFVCVSIYTFIEGSVCICCTYVIFQSWMHKFITHNNFFFFLQQIHAFPFQNAVKQATIFSAQWSNDDIFFFFFCTL